MSKPNQHERAPSRDGDAAEAAAYWDARLRSPDCTVDDRQAYAAWHAANPDNARAFEDLQDILVTMQAAGSRPMMRALRDAALRRRRGRFLAFGMMTAAAAIIVAIVGVGFTPMPGQPGYEAAALSAGSAPIVEAENVRVYETAVGERRSFTLDDGSIITLNTRSRLETRFSPERRDVTLVSGQALFKVAHNAARPFVVAAADRQVTAVGTEFDVRLDGDHVKVVLVEGRVAVQRRPEGRLVDNMISDRREISPGESYVTSGAFWQRAAVRTADVNQALLWEEGRVAFNDVPLTDAIAEMNRYSTGALVVTDPSMSALKVSGVFRTDQPQTFVNAIQEYFPVEARRQPGGDTLLVWRHS